MVTRGLATLACTAVGYVSLILPLFLAFVAEALAWLLLWPSFLYLPRFRVRLLSLLVRGSSCWAFILNPFWRVVAVNRPPKGYRPSDTLLMFNHCSSLDPWVSGWVSVAWGATFVYKSDLRRVPILGWALALCADIPLSFTKEKGGWGTKPGSVRKMMQRVGELHDLKLPVAIFPEGTRSRSGRLQLFKDGFFRYAVESKCEIFPIFLHKTPALWPCGSRLLRPGTCYVIYGEPTRCREQETVDQLRDRVRDQFVALLKSSPVYDPETDKPLDAFETTRGRGIAG